MSVPTDDASFNEERERGWWAGRLGAWPDGFADRERWRLVSLQSAAGRRPYTVLKARWAAAAAAALVVVAAGTWAHFGAGPGRTPAAPTTYPTTLAGVKAEALHDVQVDHPGARLIASTEVQNAMTPLPPSFQSSSWLEGEFRLHGVVWWEQFKLTSGLPPMRLEGKGYIYAYPGAVVPAHPTGVALFVGNATSSLALPTADVSQLIALLNGSKSVPLGTAVCQGTTAKGVGPLTLLLTYKNEPRIGIYVSGSCAWFKPYDWVRSGIILPSLHSKYAAKTFDVLGQTNWYRLPAAAARIIRAAEKRP